MRNHISLLGAIMLLLTGAVPALRGQAALFDIDNRFLDGSFPPVTPTRSETMIDSFEDTADSDDAWIFGSAVTRFEQLLH